MFAAARARRPALWGKAVVFATVTLVLRVPSVLGTLLIGQSILASKRPQAKLDRPHSSRGDRAAFYPTVVGLLAIGLAALPPNTAAGISALFGLLFVIPIVVRFLASSWADPISSYLPGSAGRALPLVHPVPAMLAPRTGFGLFSAYANAGTSGFG